MKKKLILGSALGIIMCSSLIAGATMALFTSESKVNIAVTSGKVDVSAEAKEVTTYTNGNATTENGTFENKGTAVIDDSGKLVLSGITPGDKAVVKLEITNGSSVAYKQRISLSSTLDAELMDQLIVGVSEDNQSYTYYSDYVTAWEKGEPVEEPVTTTMYLSIELPAYVGDGWQGKEGEIALAVEAVQGNADVSDTAVANEVYLVNDQTGLAKAIADMERGDTVVLYSSDWKDTDAEIAYNGDKEITVRGYGLDNVKINAAEGTVNLYNDANSLTVTAIADNSLHPYKIIRRHVFRHFIQRFAAHIVKSQRPRRQKAKIAVFSQRFRQGDKISGKTDLHRPGPFGAGLPEKSLHPPRKTGRGRETNVPKGLGRHPV